jgi:predicted negative regulator of RcsB-dependent stress response
MAEKVKVETVETNEALLRAKGFWEKFSKPIIYVGAAIIILIGGWFGYKTFIKEPKEQKASELVFPAEKLFGKMTQAPAFSKDSVNIVLNGGVLEGSKVTGLLSIMKNYDGTAAANRAEYITGACYLQLGEFDKAIKYLKEFDANGATQVESKAYVLLGHAYAEQKKTGESLDYYKKAGTVLSDKDATQKAIAMFTAASYADQVGKSKEAIDILHDLKDNHLAGLIRNDPRNPQAPAPPVTVDDVDKLLAKLGDTK